MGRYEALIELLDRERASYRVLDHAPEGRTDVVSPMRGHALEHAAKCMVVMVKIGRKTTRYVLAVVPGNARVDLTAIKALMGASYVSFASPDVAEQLAGCVVGAVLPFTFDDRLQLIVDPALLEAPELYFNAARLDRSIALKTQDYQRIVEPRLEAIALRV